MEAKSMKLFFIVLLISGISHSEGPNFKHKDKIIQQEFDLAYQDIRTVRSVLNPFRFQSLTLAQIQATTATITGQAYYCSNCASTTICVSTGSTAARQFASPSSKTTACN